MRHPLKWAVLAAGLVLPFALAFAGAAVPFLIALRLRRHLPAVANR